MSETGSPGKIQKGGQQQSRRQLVSTEFFENKNIVRSQN